MKTKRILVIDDEPGITRAMKVNLERDGTYAVRTENLATRALASARDFRPDLIFLDVMMPEVDGGHLAAQISSDRELKKTPVIFLTAIVSREETTVNGAMIAGHFFIAKPASVFALTNCIEEFTAV
jgi:DNA-binding response OmpR family regulator